MFEKEENMTFVEHISQNLPKHRGQNHRKRKKKKQDLTHSHTMTPFDASGKEAF